MKVNLFLMVKATHVKMCFMSCVGCAAVPAVYSEKTTLAIKTFILCGNLRNMNKDRLQAAPLTQCKYQLKDC